VCDDSPPAFDHSPDDDPSPAAAVGMAAVSSVTVPPWGGGGGHRPLKIVVRLTNLAVLLTIDSQKKLVNPIPPDVRF